MTLFNFRGGSGDPSDILFDKKDTKTSNISHKNLILTERQTKDSRTIQTTNAHDGG